MAWFKVDDSFFSSPKVIRIPRARRWPALGLWLVAGTWCARNLTDGHIGHHELAELGGRVSDAESLVDAQLWVKSKSGYVFHDWADYQPTKAQVVEHRDREAERKRSFRASKGDTTPRPGGVLKTSGRTPVGQNAESDHPDPTRPDPTNKEIKNIVQPAVELATEFADFWSVYPRKQGKADALKAFKGARKKHKAEVILAGARSYALLNAGEDKAFLKLPGGWLRGERWDDEAIASSPSAPAAARRMDCHKHDGYPLPCEKCAREAELPEGNQF